VLKKIFHLIEVIFSSVLFAGSWIVWCFWLPHIFIKSNRMLENERAFTFGLIFGLITCMFVGWGGAILYLKIKYGKIIVWIVNIISTVFTVFFIF